MYILPARTYASDVWYPNRGDIIKLQRLQKFYIKWIDNKHSCHTLLRKYQLLPVSLMLQVQALTSIQQDDFWSLRLSNLELRVSNPAEQKLRTA